MAATDSTRAWALPKCDYCTQGVSPREWGAGWTCPRDTGPAGLRAQYHGAVQGWALTCQQLQALLLKCFLLEHHSLHGLFAQLSPSMYGAQMSFFSEDAPGDTEHAHLLEALLEEAELEDPYLQNSSHRAPECTQSNVCRFSITELPTDVAKVLASGNWSLESTSPACQCSQPGARRLLPDCPAMSSAPPPPQALTSPGEIVQNLTGQNLSVFLVKTYLRLVHQGLKIKKWVNEVRSGSTTRAGTPWCLCQPSQQRTPTCLPAPRPCQPCVQHHNAQLPSEPHQGAAV